MIKKLSDKHKRILGMLGEKYTVEEVCREFKIGEQSLKNELIRINSIVMKIQMINIDKKY